ncbi:MAG: trypsin-like peptidase domain-containing protein, partial [Candidatus Eremiobacteraeota bacterium]|nr:trypsin-like peptidase domain-containing protein [Candidatus Eremiobacteraeota bacterium]
MKRLIVLALVVLCACNHSSPDPFVDAVRAMRPSVVLLTMDVPSSDRHSWDTEYATGTVIASGAWGSDVMTVQHAVDQARNIKLTIANRYKVGGTLVAADPKLDVAVVATKAKLPAAKLGDSSQAQPGQSIGLMGYPIPDIFQEDGLGLATSINSGRISAIRPHAIELNLPIVPGESGGPVFGSADASVV